MCECIGVSYVANAFELISIVLKNARTQGDGASKWLRLDGQVSCNMRLNHVCQKGHMHQTTSRLLEHAPAHGGPLLVLITVAWS